MDDLLRIGDTVVQVHIVPFGFILAAWVANGYFRGRGNG